VAPGVCGVAWLPSAGDFGPLEAPVTAADGRRHPFIPPPPKLFARQEEVRDQRRDKTMPLTLPGSGDRPAAFGAARSRPRMSA